ncbi:hypothetical protein GYM54_07970 [Pseudomonas sp. MTM4]|uniref:hypothetical protein n=1 Tax=unclassified Pseudomonas TaxID=196821 RepID=UPI0018D222B2|nr:MULTISPECIES: hypothetical protein [unclassified Pseudomonas]MBC8650699.1 hypothetical protein [Pseudomonas sp. MT4]QXY91534.1 hypothetical protein GYM54_07970 [Pseudomonas sp. MTM4]
MKFFRKVDAAMALSVALIPAVAQLLFGDPLYIGTWYYLVVPVTAIAIGLIARATPLFLLGTSVAISVTLLAYVAINLSLARPEGLLTLGHLFSLPGAAIGTLIGALLSRRLSRLFSAMALGFAGALVGFFLNQLVVCNTLMWCGAFSLPAR